MKNWIFFFMLLGGLYASGAGLPGFDPAYPRPATEPFTPPSAHEDDPGVSDGYPGIPHPHPDPGFPDASCMHLMQQIQMLQEQVRALETVIFRLQSMNPATDTCENGISRIRMAVENYRQDKEKEIEFQGGRAEFVRLFSEGYLKSIPEWYSQVHSVKNEIKCVRGR
ncbi:MAG: hypothetical protein H3C47_03265 [Candidatus Cloacimonetes bacterium]|nr:hypothetical protein [Candidatus Cloacimonadota bacterium]